MNLEDITSTLRHIVLIELKGGNYENGRKTNSGSRLVRRICPQIC